MCLNFTGQCTIRVTKLVTTEFVAMVIEEKTATKVIFCARVCLCVCALVCVRAHARVCACVCVHVRVLFW